MRWIREGATFPGLAWFLAVSFGGAWIWFALVWWMQIPLLTPRGQLLLLPGGFAPALAAFVVRQRITGEGFADAGLRIRRETWPYFLAAWLYPLLAVGLIVLEAWGTGFGPPNNSLAKGLGPLLGPGKRLPELPVIAMLPNMLLGSLLVTPALWGEEFGWRGYLQPRLLPGRPLAAAAVTGVIWGIWHYPLLLMGYNFAEHRLAGLAVFPVSLILVSIILGWLFERTGSIWAPSLGHASLNALGGSLSLLLYPTPAHWIFTGILGIFGWLPLCLICVVLLRRRRPVVATALGTEAIQHPAVGDPELSVP